jgi:hypothetical protein
MARKSKYQEFRVNCVGDTLAGRFQAVSKADVARYFAKVLRVRDGNTIQVWTAEEYASKAAPETFWAEHVR